MRFDPTILILLALIAAAVIIELFARRRDRKCTAAQSIATDAGDWPADAGSELPLTIEPQEMEDMAKQPQKALTQRAWEALKEHGPQTTDALASKLRKPARAVGKALSQLKKRKLATFTRRKIGETVWRAQGKAWPAK
jgi:hypothetical protein